SAATRATCAATRATCAAKGAAGAGATRAACGARILLAAASTETAPARTSTTPAGRARSALAASGFTRWLWLRIQTARDCQRDRGRERNHVPQPGEARASHPRPFVARCGPCLSSTETFAYSPPARAALAQDGTPPGSACPAYTFRSRLARAKRFS